MFNDRVILITGGTGTFGQEYTKKILDGFSPKKIIILSRDELKQFEMQQRFHDDCMRYFIGDVRDQERLQEAMQGVDYVIHAAAMRQLSATEYNPIECVKTNVYGAENVIKAAIKNNVKKVIALSSNQISSPDNVNQATRLTSEKLFVAANNMVGTRDTRFSVVRSSLLLGTDETLVSFYNEHGNKDTQEPSDARIAFYNNSVEKGVEFVLKNFERMQGGEIFVPKLPVMSISDLADTLVTEVPDHSVKAQIEDGFSEEESSRTLEFDDHYVICPTVQFSNISDFTKNKLGEVGKVISYGKQDISHADIQSVVKVLKSDFLTQGPEVPKFEKTVARYCGADHGVAVNSATSALHIACLALGLGENDVLWTSPNSFVASANCGIYCGAKVDFVDIDAKTYNMCATALEQKLQQAKLDGVLPKVVIPVHFAGQPCDMQKISELAKEYGFRVIEDASHAVGGRYKDEIIGNCRYSDITVFSFHPVKIITTGEGGVATTNSTELYEKMSRLRSHGVTRDKALMTHEPDGDWYYQQIELGFNYRMTEMQAALGSSQMNRLDSFVEKRHLLASRYDLLLKDLPVVTPYRDSESYSGLHLYPIQLDLESISLTHEQVFKALRADGIGVNLHYIPIHTQPYYQDLGFNKGDFPEAEAYYQRAISIPMYATLSAGEQDKVIASLEKVLSA